MSYRGGGAEAHIRKPKGTTTIDSFSKEGKAKQFYGEPIPGNMTAQHKREIAGAIIANGVGIVMDNHYYEVGGGLYRQYDGGSMGLDLTSITSSIYMLTWDADLIAKLIELGFEVKVYKRYVDDITVAL